MIEILTESLRTAVLVTGLVVIMMMLIEVFNVSSSGRMFSGLRNRRFGQVLLSALLGAIPGCMGGFASVSLYTHGLISFGALIAMMIASSGDEAFVMLAMFPGQSAWIFLILFVVAVAIGLLITEGRLRLDDTVASFFPEYLPKDPSPYTLRATVRDLLRMATQNEETSYDWDDADFVKTFFDNSQPKHEPGTIFHYDTAGTTVLMAVVEKITGMRILDYLRPLLDALEISKDVWCVETPEGRSWTGSGILCTPRDLLKFGQFCLQKGQWNGKQWVDREYMTQATTKQIDITVADSSYIRDGYGYQFWMLRGGAFACCGMGCQFAFMDPATDSVVILTADTQGINNAEDAIKYAYYDLLDSMSPSPLAENPAAHDALIQYKTFIPMRPGRTESPVAAKISGVRYVFDENLFHFKWMQAELTKDELTLSYEKPNGCFALRFGLGKWLDFRFPEKYAGRNIARMNTNYRCLTQAVWESENTLLCKVFSVDDYLGSIRMQLTF